MDTGRRAWLALPMGPLFCNHPALWKHPPELLLHLWAHRPPGTPSMQTRIRIYSPEALPHQEVLGDLSCLGNPVEKGKR